MLSSTEDCGSECRRISSMFMFGTNDLGGNACTLNIYNNTECECYCVASATVQETCTTTEKNHYRLYRYLNAQSGDCVLLYF